MSRLAQILWLVSSLVSGSAFAQSEIHWARDLATARRAAAQSQVPLLIHFYGDSCIPCKTLDQRVLNQDSVVKTLNRFFICVRINGSQDPAVAASFQVPGWPTDVFLSPDGQLLYQGLCKQDIAGYMDVLLKVAVSNRDRNTMLAAEAAKQTNPSNQMAGTTPAQPNSPNSSLPSLAAQPTNTPFAAPPAIAASTPAAQFQIAPPTRPGMMDSHAGLPPLAAHMTANPLGSNGLGSGSNVSGQMKAQSNMPQVNTSAVGTQKQPVVNPTASLVSNPYFPESEAMVCTPDGKCGPASSLAQSSAPNTSQRDANIKPQVPNAPVHLVSNTTASGPQFPPLAGNSGQGSSGQGSSASTAPTFQPRSDMLVSNTTSEPKLGLIENSTPQASEPAAYNGYCPISLVKTGLKVQGTVANAVRHRGRTYLMESPEAVKEFMQAPDRYSPVLSGYDPMIFLESGKLVDGTLEFALHDPTSGTIILFASADSQAKFKADPARNSKALGYILNATSKK